MSRDTLDQWELLIPEVPANETTPTPRTPTPEHLNQDVSKAVTSSKLQETQPKNDGFRPPRVYSFSNPRDQPRPTNYEVVFRQRYSEFLGKMKVQAELSKEGDQEKPREESQELSKRKEEFSIKFPSSSKKSRESLSKEMENSNKRLLDENEFLKECLRSTLKELNMFIAIDETQQDEVSLDLFTHVSEENAHLKELLRSTTQNFEDTKETQAEDNACLTEIISSTEDELQTVLEIKRELVQQLMQRDEEISKRDEEFTNLLREFEAKEQEIANKERELAAKEKEIANFEPVASQEFIIIEEFRRSMECMICLETIRLPLFACPCCAKVLGCLQCVQDLRDCPNCRDELPLFKHPLRGLESLSLILMDQSET